MSIVFFGDSITRGYPGAAYFTRLEQAFPEHRLVNCGKGGDTVISLLRRIKRADLPAAIDIALVWVGVNDVFPKVSWVYPLLKRLRRQPWAGNIRTFEPHYRNLLIWLQ